MPPAEKRRTRPASAGFDASEAPSAPPAQPVGFEKGRDVILDPRSLKGLAHPLRLRLRGELVEHGPATASQLAARIGESSGATSYHLRQLAAYGFVADDPTIGRGRERYWRAVHRGTWFTGDRPASVAERELGAEYFRAVAQVYAERIVRYAEAFEALEDVLGAEWAHAGTMSDWNLDLTPGEAVELAERFHELCAPFRRSSGDIARPGTEVVRVQFQILPVPPPEDRS